MLKFLMVVLMLFCPHAFAETKLRPAAWATPVIGTTLNNLYWVDSTLYRSEQPDDESFKALEKLGIKEILNLREYHSDEDAQENEFTVHRVPMETGSVTEEQLLEALRQIKNRKAPMLIHCWHGSDRTGVTVAAYRIIFQNWSKEQATDEMINGGYGYHASFYPNLVELINKLNVEKIKKQLK